MFSLFDIHYTQNFLGHPVHKVEVHKGVYDFPRLNLLCFFYEIGSAFLSIFFLSRWRCIGD